MNNAIKIKITNRHFAIKFVILKKKEMEFVFNLEEVCKNSSGIYLITNNINNKVYVGSTNNFIRRFTFHKSALLNGNHHSITLKNFSKKYKDSLVFTFSVLEITNELESREAYFIEEYNSLNRKHGYNIGTVFGALPESTKNKISTTLSGKPAKFSNEHREFLRLKMVERNKTENQKKAVIDYHTGKKRGVEFSKKMSQIKQNTPEIIKKKISNTLKLYYQNNPAALKSISEKNAKTYTFLTPQKEVITVTNLTAFCKENGLCRVSLRNAIVNKKIYKGYTSAY